MDGETIFAILIGAALACFSLVMVGYSFFRGDGSTKSTLPPSQSPGEEEAEAPGVSLESIYDSIDTLELEYQLGNVSEGQYREQLRAYRMEAANIIRGQLDSGEAPPELLLERAIIEARTELRTGEAPGEWRSCPECDAPLPMVIVPCPHCGGSGASAEAAGPAAGSETALQQ